MIVEFCHLLWWSTPVEVPHTAYPLEFHDSSLNGFVCSNYLVHYQDCVHPCKCHFLTTLGS